MTPDPTFRPPLEAGSTIGNYALVRPLGVGAMGAVFEAVHTTLGRAVALKLLRGTALDAQHAEAQTARFLREGRAAAHVKHPHVVDVFDFGVADGQAFLVMELVAGGTLADLLERRGRLALQEAVALFLPLISAVAELHAAGIAHRDLKPANVLLARGRAGEIVPKLADFGLSRIDDGGPPITRPGVVLGTLEYLSPEQAGGGSRGGEASDQYALGVMLYECVTGERPFRGETTLALLHAVLHPTAPPPSARAAGLPPALDRAVMRAMSPDPDARFVSVDELGEALLELAEPETAREWASEFFRPSSTRGEVARTLAGAVRTTPDGASGVGAVAAGSAARATRRPGVWLASLLLAAAATLAVVWSGFGRQGAGTAPQATPTMALGEAVGPRAEAPSSARAESRQRVDSVDSAAAALAEIPSVAVANVGAPAPPMASAAPAVETRRRPRAAQRPPTPAPVLDNNAPVLDVE